MLYFLSYTLWVQPSEDPSEVMSAIRHQYDASRIKRWKRSEEKARPYLICQAWDTVRLYLIFSSFFLILSLICDISSSSDYSLLWVSRGKEREREKLGLKIDIFPDTLKKISKNHFVSNLDYIWFIENRERISKTFPTALFFVIGWLFW